MADSTKNPYQRDADREAAQHLEFRFKMDGGNVVLQTEEVTTVLGPAAFVMQAMCDFLAEHDYGERQ